MTLKVAFLSILAALVASTVGFDAVSAPRVAVLVPREWAVNLDRVSTQVQAELSSAGFEVVILTEPALWGNADTVRRIADQSQVMAALRIQLSESTMSGRLWVVHPPTGRMVVRDVRPVDVSEQAPSIFALRAVESLRGCLLEVGEAHQPTPTKPIDPIRMNVLASPRTATPRFGGFPRWALLGGASAIGGPGGVSLAPGLVVGAQWHASSWGAAEVRLAGPFVSAVRDAGMSATINQELITARYRIHTGSPSGTGPYLVVGTGTHRMGVHGESGSGHLRSVSNSAWSWVGLVGGGLRVRAGRSVGIGVEVDALVLAPRQTVVFDRRDVVSTGRPSLAGSATLDMMF